MPEPVPPYQSPLGKEASPHERISLAPHNLFHGCRRHDPSDSLDRLVLESGGHPPARKQQAAKPGDEPGQPTAPEREAV
jgi:hypothetical protein